MKRLFGIMNLILCLELIIGPNFPGVRIISEAKADDTTCPSGLVYDSTLNRCITSEQNAMLMNATASCNGDKECYKRLAEEELKKGEQEGKIEAAIKDKSGLFNTGLKAAAVAVPLIIGAKALMGPNKCLSTGKIAMVAGGLALFVGDMLANKKHKSCLQKIRDDWEKKKAATTEQTSAGNTKVSMSQDQSEAFEMLAKSEECMQSAAKMKAGFNAAAAAAFAATAVMSVMEIFGEKSRIAKEASTLKAMTAACTSVPAAAACPELTTAHTTAAADLTAYQAKINCTAETPAAPTGTTFFPTPNSSKEFLVSKNILNFTKDVASFLMYAERLNGNVADNFSSPSIDEYEKYVSDFKEVNNDKNFLASLKQVANTLYQEIIPIKNASAQAAPTPPVTQGQPSMVTKFLTRPEPRAVISGVLSAWAVTMMMHANKQAKVAKNRAEFLRKLKDSFNEANGAISCTAEERNLSANANCYCYTDNGQRNSARGSSQVCQALWSGQTPGASGSYSSTDFSTQKVCIASNGAVDEACSCRASKSCSSTLSGTGSSLGLSSLSGATNGLQPMSQITTGQLGAGSLNGAATLNAAASLLDTKKKLETQLKDPNIVAKNAKIASQFEGALIAAAGGATAPDIGSSLPMNMTPTQAAQALEKELSNADRSFEQVSGSPALATPGNATPGESVDFSLGTEQPAAATTESQLAEVMAQDLNYGQNDITKSDSNIFKILSNRYQRSGMRRLFDEEGKTKAEEANKNDISQ